MHRNALDNSVGFGYVGKNEIVGLKPIDEFWSKIYKYKHCVGVSFSQFN
jgi:hypothetical protein